MAIIAIFVMVVTGAVVAQSSQAAWAANYPSWSDVQNARSNEAAKKAQISVLQSLLNKLESDVAIAQAESEKKGEEFFAAQAAYDAAAYKADQLQTQADEAQVKAEDSMRKAGQIAARVQRAGGQDLPVQLFFGDDSQSDLLGNLGMASKVTQQSSGIYAKAKHDQNAAQSLSDQADVAKEALKGLAATAQQAMIDAQKAADAATAALAEQAANQGRLQAQLTSLTENRELTEAQYEVGAEIRRAAEAERVRQQQAAVAAAAAAATAAAAAAAAANPGGGASAPATGGATSSGWTRPSSGYASESSYGLRVPPFGGASSWHMGTDIGAGCHTNIYAAASGRVIYAGPNGGYGNFVKIDHGGGLTTGYAHIVGGGTLVGVGQQVTVGQVIARVGMTGTASGCHLHFEVRNYETATNPVPFLRARGVNI